MGWGAVGGSCSCSCRPRFSSLVPEPDQSEVGGRTETDLGNVGSSSAVYREANREEKGANEEQ